MYLVPFLVVLSCFVHMEDFLLISVPVVYSGKTALGAWEPCWRVIELGLEVSFLNKQNILDLLTLLTTVRCISSLSDRVPACF